MTTTFDGAKARRRFRTAAAWAALWTACAVPVAVAHAASPPAPAAEQEIFAGVRILKTAGAGKLAWQAELSSACAGCRIIDNGFSTGENGKEFFFHILAPRSNASIGRVHLKLDPAKVRGVLVSFTETGMAKRGYQRPETRAVGAGPVPFARDGDGISFDIPASVKGIDLPPDDLGDVSQNYTFIETPGVYIRIGHADEARRRGPYATGAWPAVEAKAALNLEFAAREAVLRLGLDKMARQAGAQMIMLMNFDTNYPTLTANEAHDDWPPHWHMHLFWNDVPKVRKVGHFYIKPDGLLGQFMSDDWKSYEQRLRHKTWIPAGAADETRTPDGRLVYAHTITPEGFFKLGSPTGSCLFGPIAHGFDSGVILSCTDKRPDQRIRTADDPEAGVLKLWLDDRPAIEYRYDPDTSGLLPGGK